MMILNVVMLFVVQGAPSAAPATQSGGGDLVSQEEINPGPDIEPDAVYEVHERVEQARRWGVGGLGPKPPSKPLTDEDKRRMAELKARNRLNRLPNVPVPIAPDVDPSSIAPTDLPTEVMQPVFDQGGGDEEFFSAGSDGDFLHYRNVNGPSGLSAGLSPVEPSFGAAGRIVAYCGNTYAMFSVDGGVTWTSVSVNSEFPATAPQVCCDQVMFYDKRHDALIWLMQGARTGANQENFNRLAFAVGLEDIAERNWTWYDLDPQNYGNAAGIWWDYPEMTVSNNRVWFATRNVGEGTTLVCSADMGDFLNGGSTTFNHSDLSSIDFRLFQGATTVMYAARHVDTNTMEIMRWVEGGSPDTVNRNVDAMNGGAFSAPGPDGNDWGWPKNTAILGACGNSDTLFFFWNDGAGGSFPYPYWRIAQFSRNDSRTYEASHQIWNSDYAFAYAQGHPNDRWDLGGVCAYGGNTLFPNSAAWIWDDFNNSANIASMDITTTVIGTDGPNSARWGDYFTSRRHSPYGNTWAGSAFTMQGGVFTASQTPSYVWFGRRRDEPPANRTIHVDGTISSEWQEGTSSHPYDGVGKGQFAGESGDTVSIDAGTYSETGTFDRPVVLEASGGTVVIN